VVTPPTARSGPPMPRRDPAAFAEFVAARSPSLHRTAYLLVGDRGLAHDLLQEALTKTYVAWPRPTRARRSRRRRSRGTAAAAGGASGGHRARARRCRPRRRREQGHRADRRHRDGRRRDVRPGPRVGGGLPMAGRDHRGRPGVRRDRRRGVDEGIAAGVRCHERCLRRVHRAPGAGLGQFQLPAGIHFSPES
jgi:hypothetical protein